MELYHMSAEWLTESVVLIFRRLYYAMSCQVCAIIDWEETTVVEGLRYVLHQKKGGVLVRIRKYRQEDITRLIQIQQLAAQTDGIGEKSVVELEQWLTDPEVEASSNAFVITDDDDELNTWGQAGTLEGIEGEIVGYTTVQLYQDQGAYHLLCRGTVHPEHRRRNAGRALLICALNRARFLAFEFEAEQEGLPVYFEALLPVHDPASARLAARCEMLPTDEVAPDGMQLYRCEI
jgi:GNAT superfamily N-acetyltransferase